MPGDESGRKQGDHVFAKNLPKLFDELHQRAAFDLGNCPEGRALTSTFTLCRDLLSGPAFDITVDKGPAGPDGDAHSQAFGARTEMFRSAMIGYITAIKVRSRPQPGLGASEYDRDLFARNVVHADGFVVNAVRHVELSIGEWAQWIVDPEALALVPEKRMPEVADARTAIERVRSHVLAVVHRF